MSTSEANQSQSPFPRLFPSPPHNFPPPKNVPLNDNSDMETDWESLSETLKDICKGGIFKVCSVI